ncbi:MAG: DNA topoisomerase IV subunit A [Spirochaetales bacterium]|nr:DNA topoisomerase IV subunit A [Spirochaetales bacterium]
MAYIGKLFEKNFLEYASYVIKERAIPHLYDGLKPVQRRILQSLMDVDDGKFHKVANVVGHCMQYHPHGDASIYEALVNLANKEILIDRQGNFGNIYTGDPASAARYIECRLLPKAKELLYNPEITDFTESYDGRRKEPITFPAKIPLVLILGAEGIAVGMSTKILPHNFIEVLEAVRSALNGESFQLFPDFPTGGMIDVSDYQDGMGKIITRAKLDTKDDKRILVKELPYGTTTESLIASIESAAKKNKIKVGAISDFTAEEVEIEIKLPRGVHARDVIDGLYAFTDCESSISCNLLLINEEKPVKMTVTQVIQHHAGQLVDILKKELKLEEGKLLDKIHIRTLERIFIEERIYKNIEEMKSPETINQAVRDGFKPFMDEIKRPITEEDLEHLLKIPIRRISLYDIEKMKREIKELQMRLKQVRHHLRHLTEYAISYIESVLEGAAKGFERRTELLSIERVDIRDAAQRNLKMRYDGDTGYLGYDVSKGKTLFDCSLYDKMIVIKKDGSYYAQPVTDKAFVGKGILYCGLADKETMENTIFTLIYRNKENNYPYIKRCKVTAFIMNRNYEMVPDEGKLIKFTTAEDVSAVVDFKQKSLIQTADYFPVENYLVKGVKARGVRIKPKEFNGARFIKTKTLESKGN